MKRIFCQSPLVQRCRRLKYGSGADGKESMSAVSLIYPPRRSAPSIASWDRTPSGSPEQHSMSAAASIMPLPEKPPRPARSIYTSPQAELYGSVPPSGAKVREKRVFTALSSLVSMRG